MLSSLLTKLGSLWSIQKEFRQKVFFLSLTFLMMSACLSIWRPLKVSIFAKIVGSEYVPDAKLYSLFYLIPLVLIYSKLVDFLRRHQLVYCFTLFHGLLGLIFYFLLSHPVYGIANTQTNPNRLTGWAFYFFMESFNAFLSTVFWSFADSINKPNDAKNYYGFFVAGSKIGSILAAGSLYCALTFLPSVDNSHTLLPNALLFGSLLLIGATISIYYLIKKVPDDYMHGYEAVYQLERHKNKDKKISLITSLKSSIEGILIIIKNPYIMGIFSLVLIYEIIIVIFDYRVLRAADAAHSSVESLTAFYALYYLLMNSVGLVITFLGTTPLLRLTGIRTALFIFPLFSMILLLISLFFPYANVFFIILVCLRAGNYAINHPTREVLYIPTTKDIKFKAKAWTDAFGSRIAKGAGSIFNISLKKLSPALAILTSMAFSIGLTFAWLIIIYFLGRTLQNAIDNKQIIGQEEQE